MSINEKAIILHNILFSSEKKEEDLITLILSSTREDRLEIRKAYNEKYGDNGGCINDIKNKLGGDFQSLVIKLFLTRAELNAEQLIRAFGLLTSNESTVYEILFTSPKWLMEQTKIAYVYKTEKDFDKDLINFCSSRIGKVIPIFLNTERQVNENPDPQKCEKLAYELISAKVENWIEKENIIKNIFAVLSPHELILTSRYFYKKTGNTMIKEIEKLSSKESLFFSSLLLCVCSPAEMFANKIRDSIKGLGTNTNLLERVIVSRYDIDMYLIKKYYYQIYHSTAKEDIEDDTTGNHLKLIISLMNLQTSDDC